MADFNLDASNALQEIRNLVIEVNKLKNAMKNISTTNVEDFNKLENVFSNLNNKISLLGNKLNYLEAIMKKNNDVMNGFVKANNQAATATNNNASATNSNTKAINNANKTTKTFVDTLYNLVKVYGILRAGQFLKDLVLEVYDLTKTFDSLDFALEKITGGLESAADSQRFLIEITSNYGVELVSTTNRWIKFLAAAKQSGLALRDTENIFRSMTKAASVLGLKTDELQGIYLALEQMLSKGKVTTEELRRQLGERLPGAMGIMAAAIGVTLPKLDEMLKKGEVLSADVLPKFAKAVELAYDIENVNRVETLISAQNRLTASWQLFIKNISESDGVIRKSFGFILTVLNEAANALNRFFATADQDIEASVVVRTEALKVDLNENAERELLMRGTALRKEAADAKLKIEEATSKEAVKIAEEEYAKAIQALKEYNEEKEAYTKEYAKKEIDEALVKYKKALADYEKFKKSANKLEELNSKEHILFGSPDSESIFKESFGDEKFEGVVIKTRENFEQALDSIKERVVDTTAKWFLFKKLIEESNVVLPGDEDDDEPDKKQIKLRKIADLSLEIQNEILKNNAEVNKAILEDDKSSISQRRQALYDYHQQLVSIAENSNAITLRDLDLSYESEKEYLQNALAEGTLSREKYNKFIAESEEEKNQKIKIAYEKLQNDLINIQNNTLLSNSKITKSAEENSVAEIEDLYNRRIAAIKKEYAESAKTIADKEKLEKELKVVAIEAANAIIDAKIKILEASIAGHNEELEWVQAVKRAINELEASRGIIPTPEEADLEKWKKFWDTILGYASDFNKAIGDIVDNVFENRIENINAQINAEEEKYDTLIDLAEGDDEQQKTLERNKEARIKELEAKRLKEEQKQARARKAFAISDILISTAQAIMGIWAEVPKYDFGISAGLMTAFVSTLGAAQIAAVLAAPIPKYKEGGKIDREHIGMINDGLLQEYIERNGEILTTERKNAIVRLQPGDTIYKNYDEMTKNSKAINAMTFSNRINQAKFDKLFYGVESSITKGFSKARINTSIINKVPRQNDNYAASMSRWN